MSLPSTQTASFESLLKHKWSVGLWAGLGALALNLLLFALMPHLLHPVEARPVFDQPVSAVNVIRIKRAETPVRRQVDQPPPPPRESKRPEPVQSTPLPVRLSLPFAVNPRLPAAPGALVLPSLPVVGDIWELDDTFALGDLDGPLTVLARIPPIYPLHAKRRGIQGWVQVRFVVNEEGGVEDIVIVESKPDGVFDRSVIRCISAWRFRPGTIDGMAVRAMAETTIRFELE